MGVWLWNYAHDSFHVCFWKRCRKCWKVWCPLWKRHDCLPIIGERWKQIRQYAIEWIECLWTWFRYLKSVCVAQSRPTWRAMTQISSLLNLVITDWFKQRGLWHVYLRVSAVLGNSFGDGTWHCQMILAATMQSALIWDHLFSMELVRPRFAMLQNTRLNVLSFVVWIFHSNGIRSNVWNLGAWGMIHQCDILLVWTRDKFDDKTWVVWYNRSLSQYV